jgi:hypothetical protein
VRAFSWFQIRYEKKMKQFSVDRLGNRDAKRFLHHLK